MVNQERCKPEAVPEPLTVSVMGFDVFVDEMSPGAGPPLVLLHGFAASSTTWSPIAASLARRSGRRVVAFDRIGFGRSAKPTRRDWGARPSPYAPSAAGAQVVEVLDGLAIDRAVLVGHSAGAVAAGLAALDAPDRVAGLVLIAPAVLGEGPPRVVGSVFSLPGITPVAGWILHRIGPAFINAGLRRQFADSTRCTPEVVARYTSALSSRQASMALAEMTRALAPTGLTERLDDIAAPALVIGGAGDGIVRLSDARTVADKLGGPTSFVAIDDAGHLVHEEQPDAVVAAIEDALPAFA